MREEKKRGMKERDEGVRGEEEKKEKKKEVERKGRDEGKEGGGKRGEREGEWLTDLVVYASDALGLIVGF